MSDEKEGKTCLVFMNVLLLILAACCGGGALYMLNTDKLPETLQTLKGFANLILIISIIVIVFAILGLCASCGGCFLFFYTIAMNILSVICVGLTIACVVLLVFTKKNPDKSNWLFTKIDDSVVEVIKQGNSTWVELQNVIGCCGYNNAEDTKTGDGCFSEPVLGDCREKIISNINSIAFWASIGVAITTVIILIITCASNARLKSNCRG